MGDGGRLHAPSVDAGQAGMEVELGAVALPVPEERVEQQRADVARADDDDVDGCGGEHVVGVAVVAEPEIGETGGGRFGARPDHTAQPHAGFRVDRSQLGELDRTAIGADDDEALREPISPPAVGEPGAAERTPAEQEHPGQHDGDRDLVDADPGPGEPVDDEHPDGHDRGRAGELGDLDGPHRVDALVPQALEPDRPQPDAGGSEQRERRPLQAHLVVPADDDHHREADEDRSGVAHPQDPLQPPRLRQPRPIVGDRFEGSWRRRIGSVAVLSSPAPSVCASPTRVRMVRTTSPPVLVVASIVRPLMIVDVRRLSRPRPLWLPIGNQIVTLGPGYLLRAELSGLFVTAQRRVSRARRRHRPSNPPPAASVS